MIRKILIVIAFYVGSVAHAGGPPRPEARGYQGNGPWGDAAGNDILNVDDLYDSAAQPTDAAATPNTAIGSAVPYAGVGATNNGASNICLIPASGNNQLTGVTKAGTTGDTITITAIGMDCTVTSTTLQEGAGVGEYDCDGAATDVACVTNLAVVAAAASSAGKFTYVAAAGTETGLFASTPGTSLWVGVVPSDGTNTVIAQGNDGQVMMPPGTAALPGLACGIDNDNGVSCSSNTIALSAGGSTAFSCASASCTSSRVLNMGTNYIYSSSAALDIGGACAPGKVADNSGNVCISGAVEVDGDTYHDASVLLAAGQSLLLGTAATARTDLRWNTAQTVPAATVALESNAGRYIAFIEDSDVAIDFGRTTQANPTIFIQSACDDAACTGDTAEWISAAHNQTEGAIATGAGGLALSPANNTIIRGVTKGSLVDNAVTAFVRISVAQGAHVDGHLAYSVHASDATNLQLRVGALHFGAVNEGGTEACDVQVVAPDADVTPTGTLTAAFTCASNADDTIDLSVQANTSFAAPTVLEIHYSLTMSESTTVAAL